MGVKIPKKAARTASNPLVIAEHSRISAERVAMVQADINKQFKGVGRMDSGRDIDWLDPPRIRSGILGLDIISYGGLPRGGIVQFWGPKSSGKTTTAIKVMCAEQRRGNHTAFAAGEGFSKTWARHNGLWIPYATKEYDKIKDQAKRKLMEEYDRWGEDAGCGTVSVLQNVHGDGLLEMTAQVVKANVYSVVAVDSIAVLKNSRQLGENPQGGRLTGEKAVEIGQEERGGGGSIQMLNQFMNRIFSAMNTRYTYDEESQSMKMDMVDGEHMNETLLICLNQARVKGIAGAGGRGMGVQLQPTGGKGMEHFWQFEAFFQRGEEIGETDSVGEKQKWTHWALEVTAKGTKSKIGPEGRFAAWHLYIEDHADMATGLSFDKGSIDHAREVRTWGVHYDVFEQKGNTYYFNGEKVAVGRENVDSVLRSDEEMCRAVEEEVLNRCRRD